MDFTTDNFSRRQNRKKVVRREQKRCETLGSGGSAWEYFLDLARAFYSVSAKNKSIHLSTTSQTLNKQINIEKSKIN